MSEKHLRRTSWTLALPALMLVCAGSYAHPGHEDALSSTQAIMRGKAVIRSLVDSGELVVAKCLMRVGLTSPVARFVLHHHTITS